MRNMNVRSGMSRRQFMGAVGAGAAGLAGAAMFGSTVSRAQTVPQPLPSPIRDAVIARGTLKAAVPVGGAFEEQLAACIADALNVGVEYTYYRILNYDLVGMGKCDVAFGKKPWSLLDDSLRNVRIGPIYYLDSQNEGYAVAVKNGDDVWHDIVAWTLYLLIDNEYTVFIDRYHIGNTGILYEHGPYLGLPVTHDPAHPAMDISWAERVVDAEIVWFVDEETMEGRFVFKGRRHYGTIFNATIGGPRGPNAYPELSEGGKLLVPVIKRTL